LLPDAAVRVIHNGVPEPAIDEPVRNVVNVERGRFVVGTVGRLEHQKGIDRLIRLLPKLPNVHLVIVGGGSEEAELRARADRLHVSDRTTFTGWVDQPGEVMRSFDAFVLASRNEAFPLTVVEAMLRELPVVATDVGSLSDAILDGETGMLVPADQPELIADRLQHLISNPDLRVAIKRQGRCRAVEHFTAQSMAQRYVEMWRRPRGKIGLIPGIANPGTRQGIEMPRPEALS
jgi:glycosyltransferase involved in cell wall biosynthesis